MKLLEDVPLLLGECVTAQTNTPAGGPIAVRVELSHITELTKDFFELKGALENHVDGVPASLDRTNQGLRVEAWAEPDLGSKRKNLVDEHE